MRVFLTSPIALVCDAPLMNIRSLSDSVLVGHTWHLFPSSCIECPLKQLLAMTTVQCHSLRSTGAYYSDLTGSRFAQLYADAIPKDGDQVSHVMLCGSPAQSSIFLVHASWPEQHLLLILLQTL